MEQFELELFDLFEQLETLDEVHKKESKEIWELIGVMQNECDHLRKYHYINTGDGSMQCTRCKKWIR